MDKRVNKITRGSIFWFGKRDGKDSIIDGEVTITTEDGRTVKDNRLKGRRPYIILTSTDLCISNKIQVAPLKTTHSSLTNNIQESTMVLLECDGVQRAIDLLNIETINTRELAFRDFIGVANQAVMDEIDEKLKTVFGIHQIQSHTSSSIIDSLIETLVNQRISELVSQRTSSEHPTVNKKSKAKEVRFIQDEEEEEEISSKESRVLTPSEKPASATKNSHNAVEKFNSRYGTNYKVPDLSNKSKSTKLRWTLESKKQFIADYFKLSTEEMCKKYAMTAPSISSYSWKFRKELGIKSVKSR